MLVYLDEVLVASKDHNQHCVHLAKLFARFREHGLVLNPAKCQFAQPHLKFLGQRFKGMESSREADRVKVIRAFLQPSTIRQLMEFLGMFKFLQALHPRIHKGSCAPLYDATAGAGSAASLRKALVRHLQG